MSQLLEVYDPPLCCSSGVCGPTPDERLARFSADLAWLSSQGVQVRRYNLAQEPLAFAQNPLVKALLEQPAESLPALVSDGRVLSSGNYPARAEMAAWFGLTHQQEKVRLAGDGCGCGPSGCC